jgi:ribosome maturation factor RimP
MTGVTLKDEIVKSISHILEAIFFELIDVSFRFEHGKRFVTIYIDKDDGVNVEDCSSLSDLIGEVLDVEDIIPYSYILEISSPGLDRLLITKRDFERGLHKRVKVKFKDGERNKKIIGEITLVKDEDVQFETPQGKLTILFTNIIEAKYKIEI